MSAGGGESMAFAVRPLHADDCRTVAALDLEARTAASLGFLGPRFYATLYRALLAGGEAVGFVAAHADGPAGFVLGTVDTPRALRAAVRRTFLPLAAAALLACLRRPRHLRPLVSALRYPRMARGAELLVVSVAPAWQGRGVARALVAALDRALAARGVAAYRVSTKARLEGALRLYRGLGFVPAGEFTLFDEPWVVFERRLGSRASC